MPSGAESQANSADTRARVAFYYDAFNLYYAIVNLNLPFLKWIDLWALSESLLAKRDQRLVKVVFCTAYNKDDGGKLARHQKFVRAIEHCGVTCVLGHFIIEPRACHNCGHSWEESSEKQTDVNVALHLFHDAHCNVYDEAYLVTADSDQAATAKMLKQVFPAKRLVSVVPPTRDASYNILSYANGKIKLTVDHLEKVVMPATLFGTDNQGRTMVVVQRPHEYDPPQGWVHPRDRPK